MTRTDSTRSNGTLTRLRAVVTTGSRLVVDALVVGLWVLFLTFVFLMTGWSRWLFYLLLLGGVGVYVTLTASWWGSSTSRGE